jgi:2-keto-3-deoxy-L-fuconate dehydrogenase
MRTLSAARAAMQRCCIAANRPSFGRNSFYAYYSSQHWEHAMNDRLAGKTAFITAAGQGMGRAAAIAFAAEGAKVWATDLKSGLLDDLTGVAGINTRQLDATDEAAITKLAAEIGVIDVLLNCAGYVHHGSILDCAPADWDFSMNVNVRSMYLVSRAFLPGMLAKKSGSIINVASIASTIKGLPNRCVYGTSKAAVIGLTKSIAADFVKQGIRCNALCPGTIDTPSLADRINSFPDPVQARKDFIARQPMGRLGTVDDMVPLFLYLASDESSFATGTTFSVDGGMTI